MIKYSTEYSSGGNHYWKPSRSDFSTDFLHITGEIKTRLFDWVSKVIERYPDWSTTYIRIIRVEDNGSKKYFHFTRENIWCLNLIDDDWFQFHEDEATIWYD